MYRYNVAFEHVGNALDVDILDFETAGADHIITKPMKIETLDRVVIYCNQYGVDSDYLSSTCPSKKLKEYLAKQMMSMSMMKSMMIDDDDQYDDDEYDDD